MKTVAALVLALLGPPALAAPPPADLGRGGYVIVMRHAHAPALPPPGAAERQLDDAGRAQALAVGQGLKALPLGPVYASPTLRAAQTVQLLGVGAAQTRPELGDGGASMAAAASGDAGADWLKAKAAEPPPPGRDVLIVTHGPNIVRAFGDGFKDMADAEAAAFKPDGRGGAVLAARIRVEDWSAPSR